MAINVNTVYQTVLLILNKEQRGYMTPTEFNSIGTQVQLEIFEKYFEDLNQQIRVPQTDTDYADRVANLDEKIAEFKTFGSASYVTNGLLNYFTLPDVDSYNNNVELYRLGNVVYNNETEVQRVDRSDFYNIDKSKLTKPSTGFPVYLYESNFLYVKPTTITSGINVDFVKKPSDVIWGFTVGSLGQYINNAEVYNVSTQPTGSLNFELHVSEQTEVILKILLYAGIIIRDPQIVQAAAQQVQAEEINKKS
jgi:hypothetical protein|tara:strand:+ start:3816 stop:4568 length:753 start_codon:yes stop_codon:yes gene_type:complete